MAERVITATLKLDASGVTKGANEAEKELLSINQQLVKMEDELRNLSKEVGQEVAKKAFDELNATVEKNVLSIQDLGVAADNYKNIAIAAGATSPLGQEALQKAAEMERELDGVNRQVAQLAEGGRNLNAALQLGTGVIAGYSAFQGITALVGEENENLQETFVKLQAAQSALIGIKELSVAVSKQGIIATTAEAAANRVAAASQAVYATAVGTSTGLMKAFRIALISTGIGAIVVGLGLLIANFDKIKAVVADVVDWFGNMGEHVVRLIEWYNRLGVVGKVIMYLLLGPVIALVEAYQFFFGEVEQGTADMMKADREASEQRRKQHEEWGKQLKAELDGLKEKRKEEAAAFDARQEQFDLEIERMEAVGKSSYELRVAKLEDLKAELQAQIEHIRNSTAAWEAYYDKLRLERGQSREEFIASMKAQGVDLQKGLDDQEKMISDLENQIFYSESKILSIRRQNREKNQAEIDKANKEAEDAEKKRVDELEKIAADRLAVANKEAEELFSARQKVIKDMEEWERQNTLDQFQIRMNDLQSEFEQEMALFEGQESVRAELTRQFEAQINEIKEEARLADEQAEKEAFEARMAEIQKTIDGAGNALNKLNEINGIINQFGEENKARIAADRDEDLQKLQEKTQKELANEKLSANEKAKIEYQSALSEYRIKKQAAEEEDKINKRQFEREKALSLIRIGIDTASAIVKGIAQFGPPPSPAGIFAIASAGAIGIYQAAAVARQQYRGSASSITPPSFTAPTIDVPESNTDTSGQGNRAPGNTTSNTEDLINKSTVTLSVIELNEKQSELNNLMSVSTIGG